MENKNNLVVRHEIENRIYAIRGVQVMLDSHLAELYDVDTKVLNQSVKRNLERFPESYRFQLTRQEFEILKPQIARSGSFNSSRSQIVTLNDSDRNKTKRGQNLKYLPFAFTEQGVAMLSAVLRSETAVKVSIQIINAFVEMRKILTNNAGLLQRMDKVETKLMENDARFERVFKALESGDKTPLQGVFFDGQIFDAYTFVANLVRKANTSIILIDNYIDDTVLTLFSKRKKGVSVTIFTKTINKQMALDVEKFNNQYDTLRIKELKQSHDRFLILDEKELYHIGASLKDLGKKWFAFSKMDSLCVEVLHKLT